MAARSRALRARRAARSQVVARPDFERLVADFHIFVNDCETLLKDAQGLTGEAASVARKDLAQRIAIARERLDLLTIAAGERVRRARATAAEYVRREPAKALGIAAAAGAVAGLLLARRRGFRAE